MKILFILLTSHSYTYNQNNNKHAYEENTEFKNICSYKTLRKAFF